MVSPDGRWAVCSGCAFRDVRPQASDLLRIDLTSGNVETLVASQGRSCGSPLFLDDHTLFYSAYPHDWPGQNPRYFILDLDTGETRQLPFSTRPSARPWAPTRVSAADSTCAPRMARPTA